MGANELMNGIKNYCLWIEPNNLKLANEIFPIRKRIENVKKYRSESKREATKKLSSFAHRFGEVRHQNTDSIVIPQTGSERR